MSAHLVVYHFETEEGRRVGSTIMDIPPGPLWLEFNQQLRAFLGLTQGAGELRVMWYDELVNQADHPAVGQPYPYLVAFLVQRAADDPPYAMHPNSTYVMSPIIIETLADKRDIELQVEEDIPGWEVVVVRITPLAKNSPADLIGYTLLSGGEDIEADFS